MWLRKHSGHSYTTVILEIFSFLQAVRTRGKKTCLWLFMTKNIVWCVFFTWFQYLLVFGSNWAGVSYHTCFWLSLKKKHGQTVTKIGTRRYDSVVSCILYVSSVLLQGGGQYLRSRGILCLSVSNGLGYPEVCWACLCANGVCVRVFARFRMMYHVIAYIPGIPHD